jgi:predicted secreted protein
MLSNHQLNVIKRIKMGDENASKDARSHTVVFVCHCLLNQNAKVEPLAVYPGVFTPLVSLLVDKGMGIVQLPCPEVTHFGVRRPLGTDTRDQYDTPAYRKACESIAEQVVALMQTYERDGYRVACVLGVEGSPSCSVDRVPAIDRRGARTAATGSGLFIEALRTAMGKHNVSVPVMGVPETAAVGDIDATLARVCSTLEGKAGG